MYQEKMNTILLVNSYLTYCKMQDPNSQKVRNVRKYLTKKISQTLESKKTQNSSFYFIPFLGFLFR